jgi:phage terminase small subunit
MAGIGRKDSAVLWLNADGSAVAKDAELGGLGLDWDRLPDGLGVGALALWSELGDVFRSTPTRFRESDRSLLSRYCAVSALADEAEALLFAEGLMVPGRSESDAGRSVKNPANQLLRDYVMMQLSLARALALGPVARTRQGIRELESPEPDGVWS